MSVGLSDRGERLAWLDKFRAEIVSRAGTCPVCYYDAEQLIETDRQRVERLRGALSTIAGQRNTRFVDAEGDAGLSLDAADKMREIARAALKAEGWD